MYEQVFNFNARPFTSTPYVNHYYGASAINQAFGQSAICIQRGSGPVIAIGDIGTGKSLLLAKLAAEHQAAFQIVDIDCSRISSRKDLLQNILFQLGKPFNMETETELRFAVIESANPTEASPNGLLVLVDDAETLTADLFEELRVLTNIVVDGSPQVRLVLAGRKSLEERLADPAVASFSQRIASRVFLSNLSREETFGYVVEHINRVGGDGQGMFPAETVAKLHELTDGCPRLINQVCDFVLILASTRGSKVVSSSLIEEAWNDVQSLPMGSNSIATPPTSPAAESTADSEWTLIEFGQLEEDSPEPTNATVYDFENTAAPTEAPSPAEIPAPPATTPPEGAAEPKLDPVQAALASTTGIDPELGIDLGSLQAMQDAAASKETQTQPTADTAAAADSPTEEPTSDAEASQADNDARLAMEQQLAAVFGTTPPTTSTPEPATSASAETNINFEPQPQQTFAPSPNDVDSPAEPNAVAGMVSASIAGAGIVAAASQLATPATPTSTETFQPATSALDTPVTEPPATEPPQAVESSIASPPPVSSVPEPTVGATPSQLDDQITPAPQALYPIDQAHVAETLADPDTTAPATPNPFGESFAVETTVPHNVANETISQNQNAAKLLSADLSNLTPLHDPSPEQTAQQTEPTGVAIEASKPALPEGDNVETPIASMTQQQVPPVLEAPSADSAVQPVVNETPAPQAPPSTQRGFSILPMGNPQPAEPIAAEQSAPQIAPPAPQVAPTAPPKETNTFGVAQSQSVEQTPNNAQENAELRESHNDEAVSDEISRRAEEILARLNKKMNPVPAVTQEEQILSNIQQQQREVADSQLLGEPEQQSVPIPQPNPHQDDSEMLVVNPTPASVAPTPTPQTLPMADSPISSGRVTRMEYEQLFDRLRNQPEENQQ